MPFLSADLNRPAPTAHAASDVDPGVSTPAVVRGAEERRFVRNRCIDDAVRQSAAVGLLTLPTVAVVALALDAVGGRWLLAWIMCAFVAEISVLLALLRYRTAHRLGHAEAALPALNVAFGLVGATWGASAFVIDWADDGHVSAYAMFPFLMAVLLLVQTAPVTSMFRSSQIPLVAVGQIGLLVAHTTITAVIAALGIAWYGIAEHLHGSLNSSVVEGHRLRWRADELVAHLRAERVRLAEANGLLAEQAIRDPLTGLLNRRGAMETLESAVTAVHVGTSTGAALLYLDLDQFKGVNDGLGHTAGDELLRIMSERIASTVGDAGIAARFGGDEMVVILPVCDTVAGAERLAGRVRSAIARPCAVSGREMVVSASIGVAVAPLHAATAEDLIRTANESLHRAKARGRNRVVVFDDTLRAESEARGRAESAVRRAIRDRDVVPLFLPEFDVPTGRIVGVEVVASRLPVDDGGLELIDPSSTLLDVSTAERITEALVAETRPVVRRLTQLGLPAGFRFRLRIASRGSARTWDARRLRALLDGIDPALVAVSLTEDAIRQDLTVAAGSVGAMRALGMRVALDEAAGAGSSLAILRSVPLDEIRLDRRSLDADDTRPQDRAVARALAGLAHDLGIGLAAVGVDSADDVRAALSLGCTRQQGGHFSPPLTSVDLETIVREGLKVRATGADTPLGGAAR